MKTQQDKYSHYNEMIDAHKLTGKLFGIIPFYFNVSKSLMVILMTIPLFTVSLIFTLGILWISGLFILFVLFNIEYNRVYSLRDQIILECIWNQLVFEEEIKSGITQLPDAPDYIDQTDIDIIFSEAIYKHKKTSYNVFNRMFNKLKSIFI